MCMDKVTFEQYHRLMVIFNITVESKLNVTLEKYKHHKKQFSLTLTFSQSNIHQFLVQQYR